MLEKAIALGLIATALMGALETVSDAVQAPFQDAQAAMSADTDCKGLGAFECQ